MADEKETEKKEAAEKVVSVTLATGTKIKARESVANQVKATTVAAAKK
jgi:hypothetical protein